jgi:tetratricopeptide (TPR) repeat protein
MKRIHLVLLLLAVVAAATAWWWSSRTPVLSEQQWLDRIDTALRADQLEEATEQGAHALDQFPNSSQLRWLVSRAYYQRKELDKALDTLLPVVDHPGPEQARILFAAGELEINLGRSDDAERHLRQHIELDPQQRLAWQRLAYLLTIQGRGQEAVPWRLKSLQTGDFTITDLLFMGNPEAIAVISQLDQFRNNNPQHPTVLFSKALVHIRENQLVTARELLEKAVAQNSQLAVAQAWLGIILLELSDQQPFNAWYRDLPAGVKTTAGLWVVRGLWSQQQPKAAARCFWEALRQDPNHQVACYQLAIALTRVGQEELAEQIKDRARRLQELELLLSRLNDDKDNLTLLTEAAQLTEQLGRFWESYGWHSMILVRQSNTAESRVALTRLRPLVQAESRQVSLKFDPTQMMDLASYPLPDMDQLVETSSGPAGGLDQSAVSFKDVAADAGIRFRYFNSDDPSTEGRRMFEFTGGGVAILDYDGDLWPDIYLTQGCLWPADPAQQQHRDRLFRNLGNGSYQDVTEQSGLGDNRFSQGVQIGDYNNDGYPDIYLANVGENRLYANNGDGTFQDVTEQAGIGGKRWTTSCLVADLNQDGLADLYEVNYLSGDNVFDLICSQAGGKARSCSPTEFDAQQDRLFLNLGNGQFQDATEAMGIVAADGKGLGIVAADFEGTGRLSLFVANDMTANFYFTQGTQSPGRFAEQAVIRGLAYDREGKAQACMGVAVDDYNQDGLVDLFVTNFYKESNTLYVQQAGGLFYDGTRQAALRQPGFNLLGFGTQFLDAQLDGHPDLVVANGHIDDFTYQDIPFQMPPQFLTNRNGTYQETGKEAGPYFQRKLLGRGLAAADLNRDGKADFVVSHLDAPVAVLANTTAQTGNYLAIQLRSGTGQRDAIGATVTLVMGGDKPRKLVRQLTAGDGYQASNQRQFLIGVGSEQQVDQLQVKWPSGRVDNYRGLPVNRQWMLIESDPSPHLLPATSPALER